MDKSRTVESRKPTAETKVSVSQ